MILHLADGTPVEFEWQNRGGEFALTQNGESLSGVGELSTGGEGVLRVGSRVVPFYAVRLGDGMQVWVDGETYEFTPPRAGAPRASVGALPPGGEVTAPMPGRILQVRVSPGEEVAAQAPLVVMESMKMQLTLPAPAAGRVAEVGFAPGDMVDLGAVLVRLAPSQDAP
jgi:3-methylcrotonyl-CoA carboxylase alpha subunit